MGFIHPQTQLKAGPATVSGTSSRVVDGVGAAVAQSAQVVGQGKEVFEGTGALVAGSATAAGIGGRAPVFFRTPSPQFTEGVPGTYNFANDVDDDDIAGITWSLSNEVGLGTGLSFDTNTGILNYTGVGAPSTSSHTCTAADLIGQDTSAPFDVVVNPPSQALIWDWDVPSLQDETDLYNNVLGWTIPAGAADFTNTGTGGYTWDPSSSYSFGDPSDNFDNIHDNTEGDVLWAWDQQLKRHGDVSVGSGSTVSDWRTDLLAYYKTDLLPHLDRERISGRDGDGYDHLYAQGVATLYNDTGDPDLLTLMEGIRTRLAARPHMQGLVAGNPDTVSQYLARGNARWGIAAAYCYEATNDPNWATLRNAMQFAYETATDWEEGGVIRAGGGMYFSSQQQAGFDGIPYLDGTRYQSSFSLGLAAEAMWRLYVQTGSVILRERLIKMARYVQYYAHDPAWTYPNVGGRFGHNPDGSRFHASGGNGTASNAAADCSYDISLINTMVIGYKLTGEQAMLDFARTLLGRGNRYDPGGSRVIWAPIGEVEKYLDTKCDNSRKRFQFNKGQLQYAYQLLENGGQPPQVDFGGTIQTQANSMVPGEWRQIAMDDANFENLAENTIGTTRSILEFAHLFFWNSAAKELHIRGGGATGGNPNTYQQRHLRFNDAAGTWDAITDWHGDFVHQWGHFCGDPRTGDLYFKRKSSQEIYKWDYTRYPGGQVSSWPLFSTGGIPVGTTPAQALGFFPDLNEGQGGLVSYTTFADVDRIDVTDASLTNWSQIANNVLSGPVSVEGALIYLPGQKWMFYGGGGFQQDNQIGRIEADGTVTEMNDFPHDWDCKSGAHICGFSNRRVFGIAMNNDAMYEYNEALDQWNLIGSLPSAFVNTAWWACAPIDEWGVIYVCAQYGTAGGSTKTHWLYKI